MQREYELKLEVSEKSTLVALVLAQKFKKWLDEGVARCKKVLDETAEMEKRYKKWLDREIAIHNITRKVLAIMEG